MLFHGSLGILLHSAIDGGVDAQPIFVDVIGRTIFFFNVFQQFGKLQAYLLAEVRSKTFVFNIVVVYF